jgi:acyl dehydratase
MIGHLRNSEITSSSGSNNSMVVFPGKWTNEGESAIRSARAYGDRSHLVLGAGMFGDFNPLHVDEEFRAPVAVWRREFLHGPFTSALVSAKRGHVLRRHCDCLPRACMSLQSAGEAGDTLTTVWTITEKIRQAQAPGGMVTMRGETKNQRAETSSRPDGKMLVACLGT